MATAILPFRRLQAGIETTPGTLVPATRVLVGDVTLSEQQEMYRSSYPRGVRAQVGGAGVITRRSTELEVETELTAEEILWPLLTGIRGSVTPTPGGTGQENEYTWVFSPELTTAAPVINSATIEFVESDGVANQRLARVGYCMCSQLTISWKVGEICTLSYKMFGRARQDGAPTPGLSPYASREILVASMSRHWLDDSWAALGTTQLSGIVRSGQIEITTGLAPDYTADGRADLDMTRHSLSGPLAATMQLTVELDATGAALYQRYRANDIVYVRNLFEGSVITANRRSVQIDGAWRFADEPTFSEDGDLVLVDVKLESVYDEASQKTFEVVVRNGLAAA